MRIAVAYKDGEIFDHFGHCETFAIYDYAGADVDKCTKRLVPCGDRHGHQAMADLMKEERIDAVICGNMGGEAKSLLLSYGVVPVVGYCGDADRAADLLLTGQLPIMQDAGTCGGGCGGECHHDEETGECGCGCGGCGH